MKRLFLQRWDHIHVNNSSLAKQPRVWIWGGPLAVWWLVLLWAWLQGSCMLWCCLSTGGSTLYKWVLFCFGTEAFFYELLQLLLCSRHGLDGIPLTKLQNLWWESTYQGKVPFFPNGPLCMFLVVFFHSATSYLQHCQGLPRSWDIFVKPLLAKVGSDSPKKKGRAVIPVCHLELFWVLLPNYFVTEGKKGECLPWGVYSLYLSIDSSHWTCDFPPVCVL